MCVCPELLNSLDIPSDAKEKARKILSNTKGSSMGKSLQTNYKNLSINYWWFISIADILNSSNHFLIFPDNIHGLADM